MDLLTVMNGVIGRKKKLGSWRKL